MPSLAVIRLKYRSDLIVFFASNSKEVIITGGS